MIVDYIDYYNNKRLQRNLEILTPMEKHEIYLQAAYLCNMRMISEEILKNYTVDELDDILSRGYPDDSDKG